MRVWILIGLVMLAAACGQERAPETSVPATDCLRFELLSGDAGSPPENVETLEIALADVRSVSSGRRELPPEVRELVARSGVPPVPDRSFVLVQLGETAGQELGRVTRSPFDTRIRISRPGYPTTEPVLRSPIDGGAFQIEVDSEEVAAQLERMFTEACP